MDMTHTDSVGKSVDIEIDHSIRADFSKKRDAPRGRNLQELNARLLASGRRLVAWTRILDAVVEQREALNHRIWREDPEDISLEADVQTWCALTRALADLLQSRRPS